MASKRYLPNIVHEAFNRDTSHKLARRAVDAVLDLHHEHYGRCYECSRGRSFVVPFPCRTVQDIMEIVRPEPEEPDIEPRAPR